MKRYLKLSLLFVVIGLPLVLFSVIVVIIISISSSDIDLGIGPGSHDFSTPLVGEYSLIRTSAHKVLIIPGTSVSEPMIHPKVLECAVVGDFILAKRQGLKRRSPDDPNDNYEKPDPEVIEYWILDTSAPEAFGPYNLEGFDRRKEELGIDASVTLKPVSLFKSSSTNQAKSGPGE